MNRLADLSIEIGKMKDETSLMVNFLMGFLKLKRCESCMNYSENCGNCSGRGFVSN